MSRFLHHAEAMYPLHRSLETIPNYEDLLETTYRRFLKPGDVVVDVGAHSGRHTVVFAEIVGPTGTVHAFEPLPIARDWMAARGLRENVRVHPFALSPDRGTVTFHYSPDRPEESGLKDRVLVGDFKMEEITVETMPLDHFSKDLRSVSFIKVDAEGGEIGCLESGRKTILKNRPLIALEYGEPGYSAFGLSKRSLYDLAASFGYVIGDLFGGLCDSPAEWDIVCDLCYWDWYLVPQEYTGEWIKRMRIV